MTYARAKVIFPTHMEAARKRKLTPYEQKQLNTARQVLRSARKPSMNVKRKPIHPQKDDFAYKGYMIRIHPSTNYIWIEKGGFNIGSARDIEEAKRIIDYLTTDQPNPERKQTIKAEHADVFIHNITQKKAREMLHRGEYSTEQQRRFLGARASGYPQQNPKRVLIYGNVQTIYAQKTQDHICDDDCKKHGHRYYHEFHSKPKMYGLPNGDLLITTR